MQFMVMSNSLFLITFWKVFLIFSDCGPLVFLKTANPSSLYSPIMLGLYLLSIKLNMKIPISSHTSALSYYPIVTSKLLLCFLIHGTSSLYKTDFLAWKKSFMSNIRNLCQFLLSIYLNQLITLAVFLHSFTFNISHGLEFIWSKICLLILPIWFVAGLMSLVVGWFKKFALWSFTVTKQLAVPFTSTLSSTFASLPYKIHCSLFFFLFLCWILCMLLLLRFLTGDGILLF